MLEHGGHSGKIVGANIEFARTPNRLEGEPVPELSVENLDGEALKRGIGRATRDELAPHFAPDRERGDNAAEDKHTAEVVEEHSKPSSGKEGAHGGDEGGDAPQLAERRARVEERKRKRAHELEAAPRIVGEGPQGKDRGGPGCQCAEEARSFDGTVTGHDERTHPSVASVASDVTVDRLIKRPRPNWGAGEGRQVEYPPLSLLAGGCGYEHQRVPRTADRRAGGPESGWAGVHDRGECASADASSDAGRDPGGGDQSLQTGHRAYRGRDRARREGCRRL